MNALKKYYPIVLAVIGWALSFIWVKIAYEEFHPINLITLRVAGAAIVFFVIGFILKKLQPIKAADLKYFLLMAFFEPFLYFMGESHGMQIVSSTYGSVIISTIPLFTPFASYYLLKEKFKLSIFFGIIISLTGIFIMEYSSIAESSFSFKGTLLMMVAVISATFFPIFLQKLTANYTNTTILAYQNLFGFFMFLPFFMVIDFKDTIHTTFHIRPILALAGLIVFSSVLAFIFFTNSVKKIGVTKSNTFINLIPVITAFLAFFILNEALSFQKIAGILIVISGLFLSQIKFRKKHGRETETT
ncbi:DMT family transporter [Saccharicrinis sp. FJH2]|uniref:DMT family transporter n=1 Tax=unclassified Saccharicrinis TaxID=2646859 RepID=UPI0035D4FD83